MDSTEWYTVLCQTSICVRWKPHWWPSQKWTGWLHIMPIRSKGNVMLFDHNTGWCEGRRCVKIYSASSCLVHKTSERYPCVLKAHWKQSRNYMFTLFIEPKQNCSPKMRLSLLFTLPKWAFVDRCVALFYSFLKNTDHFRKKDHYMSAVDWFEAA